MGRCTLYDRPLGLVLISLHIFASLYVTSWKAWGLKYGHFRGWETVSEGFEARSSPGTGEPHIPNRLWERSGEDSGERSEHCEKSFRKRWQSGTACKVEFPVNLVFYNLNGQIHLIINVGFIHKTPGRGRGQQLGRGPNSMYLTQN